MPVFQVNANGAHPVPVDPPAFLRSLSTLPRSAPVVIMLHGFRYAPGVPGHDPHDALLNLPSDARNPRRISWPHHLGFGAIGAASEGLAIGFGWQARGSIWRAHQQAAVAGVALARLIGLIRRRHAGPVHLIGHSLGARVALTAVGMSQAGDIGRVVLLAAAAFRSEALAALHQPAGRTVEILNVTSHENDLFDLILRGVLPRRGDAPLGSGLGQHSRNWLDIRIDNAETRRALGILGFPVPPPARRVCHWSGYLRPGLFGFYSAALRRPEGLPMGLLQALLPPPYQRQRATFPALRLPRLFRWRT